MNKQTAVLNIEAARDALYALSMNDPARNAAEVTLCAAKSDAVGFIEVDGAEYCAILNG